MGEASFLTDDEKRQAAGYEPLPASFAPSSLATLRAKYDPSQPRVPAGNSDGGQWTDAGGEPSDLEQPAVTAPDQPSRDDLSDLQDIANHPAVRAEIEAAWEA